MPKPAKITVELTPRELTLVRVACLARLDRTRDLPGCESSYKETVALMRGKLWDAVKACSSDVI